MSRVFATYQIETPLPLEEAASSLAGEQSSGTFVSVPRETKELKERFAARVEAVRPTGTTDSPSLPGSRPSSETYNRGVIVVSWSVENFGYNLPTLLSTLQGNLYELAQFSGLRLVDFDLPDSFSSQFPGPRFGVPGTRKLCGVTDRPMIGTIIKPSVGMSPEETASIVDTLIGAGIDFIKDDELMANPPHSPLNERISAIMPVVNRHAEKTGRKILYAFNISDELDVMMRHYDAVLAAGGTSVMLSLNSVGVAGVKKICDRGELAIHGHRNGWGMLNRYQGLGMDFSAYQKIWRLAGVDQIHVNAIDNKFWEPDASVLHSIACCRKPFLNQSPILPVLSSGQWGGQAFATWREVKTVDLLYMAGGGIMAHPGGPESGVRAIQQAWASAVEGLSIDEAASNFTELSQSLGKFGKKKR